MSMARREDATRDVRYLPAYTYGVHSILDIFHDIKLKLAQTMENHEAIGYNRVRSDPFEPTWRYRSWLNH